jgi:hypothetical protein
MSYNLLLSKFGEKSIVENIIDYFYDNRRYILLKHCVVENIKHLDSYSSDSLYNDYRDRDYLDVSLALYVLKTNCGIFAGRDFSLSWYIDCHIVYDIKKFNKSKQTDIVRSDMFLYTTIVQLLYVFISSKYCKCKDAYIDYDDKCDEKPKFYFYDKLIKIVLDYTDKYYEVFFKNIMTSSICVLFALRGEGEWSYDNMNLFDIFKDIFKVLLKDFENDVEKKISSLNYHKILNRVLYNDDVRSRY